MASGNTILIVDDEPNLRQTLALILQKAGYAVTPVGHPHEALQSLQAGPYDLAFLDLQMPDMDGLTLLGEVRRLHPHMPVLILTAHATLESSIEAVRRGARDYLRKPVDPPLILARVRDILGEQRQSQRQREILAQIQALVAEWRQISGEELPPASVLSAQPATSTTRFLQRGQLALDLHARHATLGNKFLPLSPTDFDYLVTLARHSPDPVPYEALVRQSQGYEARRIEAQEMARWRIHQLRQALEPDRGQPQYILTVRGVGYRLVTP